MSKTILKYSLPSMLATIFLIALACSVKISYAEETGRLSRRDYARNSIRERQIVDINRSLKNVIEENKDLERENRVLAGQSTGDR